LLADTHNDDHEVLEKGDDQGPLFFEKFLLLPKFLLPQSRSKMFSKEK
jgi:hypothetical protein